jgi:TonB family protein
MKRHPGLKILGTLLGLVALAGPALAAAGDEAAQNVRPFAFTLSMRILEGAREGAAAPSKPVTSSYLKFMHFANFEDEQDVQTDAQIKKVFGLKDLSLVATADLAWEKGKSEKALYMFRLNGQEYLLIVTPGRLPEKSQFRIEVYEQSGDRRASLLDTEFSLPDKNTSVFGFENTEKKPYFITLRVKRWVGEPAGTVKAAGETVGGVVGGVIRAGTDKVKPPKLIKEVQAAYPEEARKAGVEGVVIMEATTDTYGRVASIKILRGIPLLNQAALDAIKQWVYEPMVIDGKPQPVTFTVTMRFQLDDQKKPQVEGGVSGGVAGGVAGGVTGGVEGGVEGGVVGGVVGGVAGAKDAKQFEGDAVRAVGEVKPPKLVKMVKPVYPKLAKEARVEGVVIVEAKTDENGNVFDARILRSIPVLDQAALDAVKQWKYEPMIIDGRPRKVVFTVTVRFTLDEPEHRAIDKFAEGAVKAEGDIKPPVLIKEVAPVYPEAARQAAVEGVVILSVKTDETGRVVDTMVLRSIPLLDQAAIDAVRQWVYEPFVKDGKAQPIVFTVTVRFQLKENIVKPGATLDIAVEGLPSLDGAYRVSPAGDIDFKLLGEVPVANLSSLEVSEFLASELDKKYTKNARVLVAIRKN